MSGQMTIRLNEKPWWSLGVLGCGGGPLEDDLSAFLCKPFDKTWSESCFAIEGGSGLAAVARLIRDSPQSFSDFDLPTSTPPRNAAYIMGLVRAYLISHGHLDHIAGLVLAAGSIPGQKLIYGTKRTLQNLQNVFDGGVWPALASFHDTGVPYSYRSVEADGAQFSPVKNVQVTAHQLCHGCTSSADPYESTAFLFTRTDHQAASEFLFLGDVGPDSLSGQQTNRRLWAKAAERIVADKLSIIFIECSYASDRKPELLYGHLSPPYLFEELRILAQCVDQQRNAVSSSNNRPLQGLNVCIMHIKEDISIVNNVESAFDRISGEILELEKQQRLGINFVFLRQGMRLGQILTNPNDSRQPLACLYSFAAIYHEMSQTVTVGGVTVHSGLYIGGKWLDGHGDPLDTVNPATEEKLATIQTANKADVDAAVAAARECFETKFGTNMAGTERGRLLWEFAEAIAKGTDDLAILESLDSGKPLEWCKADIADTVGCLKYFAGWADKIHGVTVECDDQHKYATVRKEPIGVCAQIVPWNYPLLMLAWKIAAPLAVGCPIVFKAAENTPLSTLKLAEIFDTVGYPAGVWNVINGVGAVTGKLMAEHMDIDKIAFTGSTITGRAIATAAANSNLKKVTLELGGKSAHIIFEKADLIEAAKWAAFGIFENMGQSCTAGSRILVQESIYDEFLPLLKDAASKAVVGDPLDRSTFNGAIVSKVQFDRVMGYIEKGKQGGGKLLCGGARVGEKGYFVAPTLFTDVTNDAVIAKEEIFGPVGAIIKFKDEADAIRIANDTPYGLAAGVHTLDYRQMHRVTRRLKAGTLWQNSYVLADYKLPFGGYKQSGWGRELGYAGLESYLETKCVHHNYSSDPLDWPIEL